MATNKLSGASGGPLASADLSNEWATAANSLKTQQESMMLQHYFNQESAKIKMKSALSKSMTSTMSEIARAIQ